ncbi:hypothetical protein [Streptomyces sp. NBRC 110035]|uniref:hypothetical protein n=1 Tax=Streptomyces sp. NBRC 110035 TaxID=1547867 RepID=UPI000A638CC6|nr:hypothetical protein [Streptomyces sp. NBRC 110035]
MVLTRTPAWHTREAADERAWLDHWAQLHLAPLLEPQPVPAAAPALTLAGSPR